MLAVQYLTRLSLGSVCCFVLFIAHGPVRAQLPAIDWTLTDRYILEFIASTPQLYRWRKQRLTVVAYHDSFLTNHCLFSREGPPRLALVGVKDTNIEFDVKTGTFDSESVFSDADMSFFYGEHSYAVAYRAAHSVLKIQGPKGKMILIADRPPEHSRGKFRRRFEAYVVTDGLSIVAVFVASEEPWNYQRQNPIDAGDGRDYPSCPTIQFDRRYFSVPDVYGIKLDHEAFKSSITYFGRARDRALEILYAPEFLAIDDTKTLCRAVGHHLHRMDRDEICR